MSDTDEEETDWQYSFDVSNTVALWNYLICNAFLALVSATVLLVVVKIYKRVDWFLVAIPTLMLMYGTLSVPKNIATIKGGYTAFTFPQGLKYSILQYTADWCFHMAHWFFSTQYLHTSLILPRLFTQAKIEWLQDDAAPQNN